MSVKLSAQQVRKVYGTNEGAVEVLNDLSLDLYAGEKVAIVGGSGAGKSTLLNILGGLDNPTSGKVLLEQTDLCSLNELERSQWRNRHLGFVFQFHHLMPEFSALEAVAMPARIGGKSKQVAVESAKLLLEELGLEDRMNHRPAQLSGGERQRVAIARALINRPTCVLMDEPTGNLDPATAEQVLSLIHDLIFTDTAFVIVTHDPRIAAQMDKRYRLQDGQLCPE
jgi:lipoprotein-releasing system ATP-binding protein